MEINEITEKIIGCAMKVHSRLGPGLLESAYKICLVYELRKAGLYVDVEVPMPIVYDEVKLDHGYRIDLLVERKIVVEIKTVEAFTDVHSAQILTYMSLGQYNVGLLINFHVSLLKHGINRFKL